MSSSSQRRAYGALGLSTLAFTACFALWMQNGVLVTYLSEQGTFSFDEVEIGWLLGVPVLTGSILRLPVGLLSDRYGGRKVFSAVLLAAALGAFLLSRAQGFWGFLVGSLGFGVAGTSFAVGVAYTSAWFPKERQGTALGIFGAGNAGSAVATLLTPWMLEVFTAGGADPEGWRAVPLVYAALMVIVALAFALLAGTPPREARSGVALREQLTVLRSARVWRFGLYYFLVFGCFVALAQWLVPYYTTVFGTSLATAGLLAAVFSFPSGVVRALGGWMSDRWGARRTMYGVLGVCVVGCFLLSIPSMRITTPGEGVSAKRAGVVTAVTESAIGVGPDTYPLRSAGVDESSWAAWGVAQEPAVRVGERVQKKQVLARGTTTIRVEPSIVPFTFLVFLVGLAMGVGKAAVYKYIPEYFPGQVGAVGGLVGVIGGLGGFVCPILFGYLLRSTGLWTSSWAFLFALSVACLAWLHVVVGRIEQRRPRAIEGPELAARRSPPLRVPARGVVS
jgi:NNP family nitrate/nitrite transporter-like MFS transporter